MTGPAINKLVRWRGGALRPAVLLAAALLPAGCGKTPEAVADHTRPYEGPAWIAATPNPVRVDRGPAATTVSWHTGRATPGEVYLSVDGRPETFFSGNDSQHQYTTLTGPGVHEYRLYADGDRSTPLATVRVTQKAR